MITLPLIAQAQKHHPRTAIIAPEGVFTYGQLLQSSAEIAAMLLAGRADLHEERVAFLIPPGLAYVAVQWAIWRAGGIAVPLALSYPPPELAYVIADAEATIVVAYPDFAATLRPIAQAAGARFMVTTELNPSPPNPLSLGERGAGGEGLLPAVAPTRRAMILYTSGTTGKPKGAVTTHHNIEAQVTTLLAAWEWTPNDHILHVLPLHHTHGIINVLTCALWAGARCQMLPAFDAEAVWTRFIEDDLTLFMAVPTIYTRLIAAWEGVPPARQQVMSTACAKMRLMVSGSAALPVQVLERWQAISGHILLERYGMTEIGMALSNPLYGRRRPGYVGTPLPGVSLRLVDEAGTVVETGAPGEIEVKGPGVFLEYWRRPEATAEAFRDGWFRTGDIAVVEDGAYRLLGRQSVDIIKTGGYKVSALEIEEVLRTHPAVAECAIVGLPDAEWGERIGAALVLVAGQSLTLAALRDWAKVHLAPYKIPTRMVLVEALPRNAMGKVTKPAVGRLFGEGG
jgi:malonyl-CoA/methylmalonyl-CoA synthetase